MYIFEMINQQICLFISALVLKVCSMDMYTDIWNFKNLTEIKNGNLKYYFDLPHFKKEVVSIIYKYLDLLYRKRKNTLFKPCKHASTDYVKLLCYWKYFYHCMNTTNVEFTQNLCNPFYDYICYAYTPPPRIENDTEIYDDYSTVKFGLTKEFINIEWSPLHLPMVDHELILGIFNLYFCTIKWFMYLCPDYCASVNPCRAKNHIWSSECHNTDFFKSQISKLGNIVNEIYDFEPKYKCACKSGYTWSYDALECIHGGVHPNPCDPNDNSPCDEIGTLTCIGDTYTGNFRCRCKPRYYGRFCDTLINACMMNVVSLDGRKVDLEESVENYNLVNGSMMCKIDHGGLPVRKRPNNCVPQLGSLQYVCECHWPFIEDLSIKIPNCFQKQTACYHRLCGPHGVCRESEDGKDSICVCEPGYEGESCHFKISSWSHWSECDPNCGTFRFRSRFRLSTTFIDNDYKPTHINYTQSEWCPDRLESDCPIIGISSSVDSSLVIPFTNDEILFYTSYMLSMIVSVLFITLILYCSRLISTPSFARRIHKRRQKSSQKIQSTMEKQRMSLMKVEAFNEMISIYSGESIADVDKSVGSIISDRINH